VGALKPWWLQRADLRVAEAPMDAHVHALSGMQCPLCNVGHSSTGCLVVPDHATTGSGLHKLSHRVKAAAVVPRGTTVMMPGISLPINSCTTSLSAPLREASTRRPALLCSSIWRSGGQLLQYHTSSCYCSSTSSSRPLSNSFCKHWLAHFVTCAVACGHWPDSPVPVAHPSLML
jgi:hypothetical protein